MPELHLIIADPALRAAVAEQMALAAPEGALVREGDRLPASFSAAPAAIVLDAPLADRKTLRDLRGTRAEGGKVKIFILGESETGMTEDADENFIVESFSKPLRLGHLIARVQFHLQTIRMQAKPLTFGPFRLDPAARQVVSGRTGAVIHLTEKETHLLEYLGRSEKPVAREELLAAIWGYDARIDTHTLETHIYGLRRKLDPEGGETSILRAEQGAYRLAAQAP